jgi:hypothetical protein
MSKAMASLAQRVADDPAFLAHALAEHAQGHGLDDAALAEALGCAVGQLPALRLCLRPRADPAHFLDDITEIVARFGVVEDTLIEVVRYADALLAIRGQTMAGSGLLMAARDREPDEDDPESIEREP